MDDQFEHGNDHIIRYLMDQHKFQQLEENVYESDLVLTEESPEDVEYHIYSLVAGLISNVEAAIKRTEEYSEKLKAHNQYALFNMKNVIRNFEIDDNLYDKLTFRETLLISRLDSYNNSAIVIGKRGQHSSNDQLQPVGGMCIDVQKASGSQPFKREDPKIDLTMMDQMTHHGEEEFNDNPRLVPEDDLGTQRKREMSKLLVHVSSDFDYFSKNGGSRITSWLDRNLHTLEELRREYLMEGKDILEEQLLMTLLKPNKYYVKHKDYATKLDDRKMYMLSKAKDYISEGTNFVLMRYIAINKYIGVFELSCMYINGDMCRNIYECFGPEGGSVNGQKIDICKIDRTIIEECGLKHYCKTILSLSGRIIKQEWINCNFILHVNPLLQITNDTPPGNDQVLLKDCWLNDMQLMSKYLDEKNTSGMKLNSYLLDHTEIKKMVADYVQKVLMRKPLDIIEYTIEHFLDFAPEYMPRYDFMN